MRYTGNERSPKMRGTLASAKLERVLEFMACHLAERVTVAKLAEAVHMSAFHFTRMFKASVGMPPHMYLTAQRVQRAKQLLEATDTPLVDVAADAGFQTQSHFTGVFHRYTGTTPRAFRMRARTDPAPFHGRLRR
jgi:AraC family transcriptional regulator